MPETALRALTGQEIENYATDGYHIARQLLGRAEVDEIRGTFMAAAAGGPVEGLSETVRRSGGYDATDPLAFYPRMMHPHRHADKPVGPVAMRYMLDGRIGDLLHDLFGEPAIAAQSMFYFKPPGSRGQDFHQDNFYLRVKPGSCMAAWAAIDDADEHNGGMMLVPGSHRMEVLCPEPTKDRARFFSDDHLDIPAGMRAVQTRLKAGDVLFFNGSLIHGSFPNSSADRFRCAFICHYIPQSCIEVAEWYRPLHDFSGRVVSRQTATSGGPCGEYQAVVKGPH